jgi:hypothetical protein
MGSKENISLFTYHDAVRLFWMVCYTVVLYYILFFLATGLHEMFHMITGNLLGYDGSIRYSFGSNLMGFYHYQSLGNELHDTLILLSGGLGTSLMFLIFFLLVRKYDNPSFKFVIVGVILWQFFYCLLESKIIPSDFDSLMKSSIAFCVGAVLSFLINLKGFVKVYI